MRRKKNIEIGKMRKKENGKNVQITIEELNIWQTQKFVPPTHYRGDYLLGAIQSSICCCNCFKW